LQIKENNNNNNDDDKKKYFVWQKDIPTITILARCFTILVLSAIILLTPSLSSSQIQHNSSKYSSSDSNANNSHASNSQIAVFSADSKPL
jgi:hypothetical protein